jgi:hypothetical protein
LATPEGKMMVSRAELDPEDVAELERAVEIVVGRFSG